MGTKMKGLLKGLRYITQKFDEDKESEMKIGYPTDVKHVAHIGWDGTSVDSPSWMKEFRSPHGFQSAPLSVNGEPKENPEIKWVSQDSSRRILRTQKSPLNDMEEELPKTTRRHSSAEGDRSITTEIPTRDSSTKTRQSRRSSNSSKPNRQPKDSSLVSDPSSQGLPDIPKKARRKKSKESVNGGSSRSSSRSKANAPAPYTSPFLDHGPNNESISRPIINDELCQSSNLKPFENEGDKECNGAS